MTPWYRLGYLTPHRVIDTLPYQFYEVAPPGMMLVAGGTDLEAYERASAETALSSSESLLDAMGSRRVDRVVIAGVPLAAALGRARMRARLAEFSERVGVTVDTDFEAMIKAMHHLRVRRVAIATRWKRDVINSVASYLADADVEVVAEASAGRTITENAALTDTDGMRMALELGRSALESNPSAEGLMLPGLRWIVGEAVVELEREFDRPVFANVSASTWAALRSSGWRGAIQDGGRLLSTLSREAT